MWIIISCAHPRFIGGINVDNHFLCSPRFIGGIHVDHHFLCSLPVYWWDTCGSSFPVFTPCLLVGYMWIIISCVHPGLIVRYMWIIISCVHPRFVGGIHVDHHFLCSPRFIGELHVDHHFLCSPRVYWWDTCGSSFPVFTPCLLVGYMWIIIS
jgi:hypothetical protein